nr:MAG TPA: hypothetical protein [Caudoviricetes sp.]
MCIYIVRRYFYFHGFFYDFLIFYSRTTNSRRNN